MNTIKFFKNGILFLKNIVERHFAPLFDNKGYEFNRSGNH